MESNQVVDNVPSVGEIKQTLLNTKIVNENVALNVIVSFLNLAQRRGAYSIDEASKIWECISIFNKSNT